ncbi:MAG: hypothetical protein QOI10_4375 [Solirubrobacterales bacterium]|nr:hypothetical protein [Solirubrobacterales bacterium]
MREGVGQRALPRLSSCRRSHPGAPRPASPVTNSGWTSINGPNARATTCNANPAATQPTPSNQAGWRTSRTNSRGSPGAAMGTCLVARCCNALSNPKLAALNTAAGTATAPSIVPPRWDHHQPRGHHRRRSWQKSAFLIRAAGSMGAGGGAIAGVANATVADTAVRSDVAMRMPHLQFGRDRASGQWQVTHPGCLSLCWRFGGADIGLRVPAGREAKRLAADCLATDLHGAVRPLTDPRWGD